MYSKCDSFKIMYQVFKSLYVIDIENIKLYIKSKLYLDYYQVSYQSLSTNLNKKA